MQLSIKYRRYVDTLERNGPVDPMGQIATMDKDKVSIAAVLCQY